MKKRVAAVVLVMASMMAAARTPAAAPGADALRFPGRRPGTRPRNPVVPGYPGARPSPPTPGTRPPPPPTPGVPPCPRSQLEPPGEGSRAPLLPGFPGLPGSGGAGSTLSSPTDCVTPLAGLMTCGTFLTGSESDTPTPQSECCTGLAGFITNSTAAGDGDRTLRCLCPVILGDVNKMLPKPVDPVRMMYLPIACGVTLPPQVLFICFTGQPSPPVVSRIPEIWEKPNSALSP